MSEKTKIWRLISVVISLLVWGTTSCASRSTTTPTTWIDSPGEGASIPQKTAVTVNSHVFAHGGVAEVVLSVNGEPYRRDVPAESGLDFISIRQEWIPDKAGTYQLQVQGYDLQGLSGSPASVSVEVVGEMVVVPPAQVISVTPVITITPTNVISITPPPPPASTVEFYSSPPEIDAGSCAKINWKVENAQRVIFGGIDQPFSGSYQACLCSDEQYTLNVINLDGTKVQRAVTVNVNGSCVTETPPPPAVDTTAPPVPSPAVPAHGLELSCRSAQNLVWLPVTDDSGISGYLVKLEKQVKKGVWQSAGGYGPVSDKQVSVKVDCGGSYRWMVRAQDGAGNFSNWSAPSAFSIVLN